MIRVSMLLERVDPLFIRGTAPRNNMAVSTNGRNIQNEIKSRLAWARIFFHTGLLRTIYTCARVVYNMSVLQYNIPACLTLCL